MGNIFKNSQGSWVKRHVGGRRDVDDMTGKDMDLKKQLFVGEERKKRLMSQIEKDTEVNKKIFVVLKFFL